MWRLGKILFLFFCLIIIIYVGVFFAANGSRPHTELNQEGDLILISPQISNIELLENTLQPDFYIVVVTGNLPDNCMQLQLPTVEYNQQDTFTIDLKAYKPDDAICLPETTEFTQDVELDLSQVPKGEYQIKIQDQVITVNK